MSESNKNQSDFEEEVNQKVSTIASVCVSETVGAVASTAAWIVASYMVTSYERSDMTGKKDAVPTKDSTALAENKANGVENKGSVTEDSVNGEKAEVKANSTNVEAANQEVAASETTAKAVDTEAGAMEVGTKAMKIN